MKSKLTDILKKWYDGELEILPSDQPKSARADTDKSDSKAFDYTPKRSKPDLPANRRPKPLSDSERQIIKSLHKVYSVMAAVLGVCIIAILLAVVAGLPEYGSDDTPTMNEVAERYIEKGLEETGAVNIVSGMILDYRAFDTLGESHVLFSGLSAVTILLLDDMAESRRKKKKEEALEPAFDMRDDMILRHVCRVIIPIVFMFGIYIIFNGHISPGGGFAGGSIIGAGMILYSLSFGADKVEQLLNKKRFRIICVIALAFYSLSKCYVFFCGYNGFETHIPLGIPGELLSAGLILPLNIAVGATVACTMYGIYSLFVRGRI